MKAISDGASAYINDRGDLYLKGDEIFQEEYYEEWYSQNAKMFENDMSGSKQADGWDAHYSEEIAPYDVTDSDLSGVFVATMVPVGIIVGLLASMALVILVTAIGGGR